MKITAATDLSRAVAELEAGGLGNPAVNHAEIERFLADIRKWISERIEGKKREIILRIARGNDMSPTAYPRGAQIGLTMVYSNYSGSVCLALDRIAETIADLGVKNIVVSSYEGDSVSISCDIADYDSLEKQTISLQT